MITSIDVDTVVSSYYGTYEYSSLESLASLRDLARLYDNEIPCSGQFQGWTIKPFGLSSKGFSYILRREDVVVMVGRGTGEVAPNMRIEIGSLTCHDHDLPTLVSNIHNTFSFDCRQEKLTRGDLCRDADCDFSQYVPHVLNVKNWYWNRKVKFGAYFDGDRFTGVQFGKGNIVGRLYDKSYKLLQDGDVKKSEFYSNYYGVDLSSTSVFRLEYQMRRQYFRSVGVETLEDFLNKREEIWAYLTGKWVFLSGSGVGRRSGHSKAENVECFPLWSSYLVESEPVSRQSPRRILSVSDRIFRQGFGCIMSYVLRESEDCKLSRVFGKMLDYMEAFIETQLSLSFGSTGLNRYEMRLRNFRNKNRLYSELPF